MWEGGRDRGSVCGEEVEIEGRRYRDRGRECGKEVEIEGVSVERR